METPAGWHLIVVQDMQEEKYGDFEDAATRKMALRKYLDRELDAYTANLRKNEFTVEVSAGTYVRALARDLGRALGCGGALAESSTSGRWPSPAPATCSVPSSLTYPMV